MGSVIYSANPIQAFIGPLGTIALLLAIGLVGIGLTILRRKESKRTRLITGVLGGFLIIVSCVFAGITISSITGSTQTVSANLEDKRIAEDNCGDNGETCARYVLETTKNGQAYDFVVPQDAFNKAQLNTCYKFTYYPSKGLFANDTQSYQLINNTAQIETADPASCR